MRGGAQAHLLEGEDGGYYVAKFTNNPQHRRILINEWLACVFLRYLQIYVPETALVELTPDFIESNPELYFSIGPRREPVKPGLHFGSRMAVDPNRVAVFDFLPDKLLGKVENRIDFLGMLVFDKWVGNADSRQAVFFRARAKNWTPLIRRSAGAHRFLRPDDRSWICLQRAALGLSGFAAARVIFPDVGLRRSTLARFL
jgi:hypothetical protein